MPARGGLWQGSKWIRRERRLAIYIRDGWCCVWCGATERLSLDHLRPNHERWDNATDNLVTSCLSCNCRRSGMRLGRWLRRLRSESADVRTIVGRLRRQVRAPIDLAAGRAAIERDRSRRRAVGAYYRRNLWVPGEQEGECIPF